MSAPDERVLARARDWAAHDPDPVTRTDIEALIEARDPELKSRFAGPLTFGTAGLRGRVEGGESRLNLATVTIASAGLAEWLSSQVDEPSVVVGCDARYSSDAFRKAAVEVFSAAGLTVYLLPAQLPTPLTAFAVRRLGADAGVMVTASHNPAGDNGYKVYLGGRVVEVDEERGVQLVPPADEEIAAAIQRAPWPDRIPRDGRGLRAVGPELVSEYLDAAVATIGEEDRDLEIVLTPVHGVGGNIALRALNRAGFGSVSVVEEQFAPDPAFPTAPRPNPEEPGVMDLAIAQAARQGADLVLALDPDADRLACAVPEGDPADEGSWRRLTGDEVGGLLGERAAKAHEEGALASSVVSSTRLQAIAKKHGLEWRPTLTGFKWIGRTPGLVFGYEEALGYCADPGHVRDKDGITAALALADLAQRRPLTERLADLDEAYGAVATGQLSVASESRERLDEVSGKLRAALEPEVAGSAVAEAHGLDEGYLGLPPAAGWLVVTERGDRVLARPSGTEPKLKCYLEAKADTRAAALERLEELKAAVSRLL